MTNDRETVIKRYPVVSYFVLTFAVSWGAALAVAFPSLARHEPVPKLVAILMFPAMLVGPCLVGTVLTGVTEGKAGVRDLFSRMGKWRVRAFWYLPLLIPPAMVLLVLIGLKTFVSPAYAPNFFWMGVFFGIPAGFFEEIGWMGYAFPKMIRRDKMLAQSIFLGMLWSLWHLPVVDYLGAASPHGSYWFPFFLSFAMAMTAMRVLICSMYFRTRSVMLAQLMHVSSTGSLVVFGAAHITPAQEVLWYGIYGIALWLVASMVASRMPAS